LLKLVKLFINFSAASTGGKDSSTGIIDRRENHIWSNIKHWSEW